VVVAEGAPTVVVCLGALTTAGDPQPPFIGLLTKTDT
jgi:hypothetical protein